MEFLITHIHRLLAFAILLLASQTLSFGQLNVDLEIGRRQFISHEAVPISVQLTNRAGRELLLHGDGRRSWLNIQVVDSRGNLVPPFQPLNFQAAKIPVGRSVAKQINLNALFPIQNHNKYTVYTIVSLPTGETFQSGRKSFDITKGRTIYDQRVGLGSQSRDYRLITFSHGRTSFLYFQAELVAERRVVYTYPLGEFLQSKDPEATVDKSGQLNVLYLGAPNRYVHVVIDSRGKVAKRKLYQRGPVRTPRLVAFADGQVEVAGGILFDPEAQKAKQAAIRKISERPRVLFD